MISHYNKIKNANAKYVFVLKGEMINGDNKIAKLNKQKLEHMQEIFKEPIDKGLMTIIVL